MKYCVKCGTEIKNGLNGCMMLNVCFDCNGGYPDYSRNKSNFHWNSTDWNDLDAAEDRCIKDYDD